MKIIMVEWDDAHVLPGWRYGDDSNSVIGCLSFGILKRETDKEIELYPTTCRSDKLDSIAIPKGCIKRMTTLIVKRGSK